MTHNNKSVTLTEQNFRRDVLESATPVLVDFGAGWCGPCRTIAPVIAELASDFDGKATVGKVDVDEQPGLAQQYGIRSIPSLLFFRDGQVVDRVIGTPPRRVLAEKLERLLPEAGGGSPAGGTNHG